MEKACYYGDACTIERLLKLDPNCVHMRLLYNRTPLIRVCEANRERLDCIKLLIERGANVDDVDDNQESALYWAALKGHLNIVKYLVDVAGADVNLQDTDGKTAYDRATAQTHVQVAEFLRW